MLLLSILLEKLKISKKIRSESTFWPAQALLGMLAHCLGREGRESNGVTFKLLT